MNFVIIVKALQLFRALIYTYIHMRVLLLFQQHECKQNKMYIHREILTV